MNKYYLSRKKAGLNQVDVAEALNVKQATVSLWESGSCEPKGKNLVAYCKLVSVDIDEFLKDETNKNTEIKQNNQSQRIEFLRKKSGLSPRALSQYLGVSHVALRNWESDPEIDISSRKLFKLASLLNTTAEFILFGDGEANLTESEQCLSTFYGLIINSMPIPQGMYISVNYRKYSGLLDAKKLTVVSGDLPRRAVSLALDWLELNQKEIIDNWNEVSTGMYNLKGLK